MTSYRAHLLRIAAANVRITFNWYCLLVIIWNWSSCYWTGFLVFHVETAFVWQVLYRILNFDQRFFFLFIRLIEFTDWIFYWILLERKLFHFILFFFFDNLMGLNEEVSVPNVLLSFIYKEYFGLKYRDLRFSKKNLRR